mgnify:CR=1 FL=1
MNAGLVFGAVAFWLCAWAINEWLVRLKLSGPVQRTVSVVVPLLFGISLLVLWEGLTRGFSVPNVLLPPPSAIWQRITVSTATLWADSSAPRV